MTVAIVGGGIVGAASAYYCAERGLDVTLLEKGSLGGGSTGRANGGIRAAFGSPVSIRLSQASIAVWEDFEGRFGVDVGYFRPGYLFLAREEGTAARLREVVAAQNDHGVESEFLDPAGARERCPGLHADRYAGAAYSPGGGFADPHLALQGFAGAARDAGAEIRTGVEVTGLPRRDGRVVAVETTEGRLGADRVVNAAGPWAREVAAMAGLDLPVSPRRRQLAVVEPERPVDRSVPMTVDMDGDVHFRPERDGAAVVGGFFADTDPATDPDRFDEGVDLDWAADALEAAADCADYFGPGARLKRGWAGLYAVTPDHHPVIEETIPGLVNAVGFSGHGFMQAPATGRVVAELVADGAASTVDVSSLAADRFERGAELEEGTVID